MTIFAFAITADIHSMSWDGVRVGLKVERNSSDFLLYEVLFSKVSYRALIRSLHKDSDLTL